MKIAILSDIHEGYNRTKTKTEILPILINWMQAKKPDVFIISGDMANHPEKALDCLNQLQAMCPHSKVLFVHGNHDIYDHDAGQAYKILLQFPGNLGNGPVELDNNWVIIGDGGWFDYSLGMPEYPEEDFSKGVFGNIIWPDKKLANWNEPDQLVASRSMKKLASRLDEYGDCNIIMITHFVPFKHFVQIKNQPEWDFFNAMMGSEKLGELAVKYGVKKYIFGHIHSRYHEYYQGIEMICNPLGYYPHEWEYESAEKEIHSAIKVIEI